MVSHGKPIRRETAGHPAAGRTGAGGPWSALRLVARQRLELLDAGTPQIDFLVEPDLVRLLAGQLFAQRVVLRREKPGEGQDFPARRRRVMDDEQPRR